MGAAGLGPFQMEAFGASADPGSPSSLPDAGRCSNKGDPPAPPPQGPSAGDGHCVSPEAREGVWGGETPWPRGDLNIGLGEVWGSENKGGQGNVSDGDTARQRGPPSRCGSGETAGTRGGGCAPPSQTRRHWSPPHDIPVAHVRRATPVVPVYPGARQRAPAFVQTLAGEGAQASEAEQRAPESARRAPAPRLAAPCFPARRALCFRPGPGPEGAAWCQGRAGGGGALPTCLCEAEPGAPWVL